ncbi:DUF742 domain-containing protein [Streptomyces sp.]|uniref:DUF742 domain-containing protein n=1 Tax=Streptomyces sp. TaxID=1931 RepID=UPI002810AC92|nr:DUF742 domain-containing protein [Streptomyces sp.]
MRFRPRPVSREPRAAHPRPGRSAASPGRLVPPQAARTPDHSRARSPCVHPVGPRLSLLALWAYATVTPAQDVAVAELAAGADLPVGVVRVLLGDLLELGCVTVSRPVPPAQLPDERILREVIEGLRAL